MRFQDHWQIVREFGKGGQGTVFLAGDTRGSPDKRDPHWPDPGSADMSSSVNPRQGFREEAFEKLPAALEDLVS